MWPRRLHQAPVIPSLGVDGSNKEEFLHFGHTRGMTDLINKRCGHHGYAKQPSFGVEGRKKKEFCSEHKRDGVVDM